MKIAVVCPDGLSVLLFCRPIIKAMRALSSDVLVVTDAGAYVAEIEELAVRCRHVPISRYADPLRDLAYAYRLFRLFRAEGIDAVLNFSTKPNVYGGIAARLAGVSHVCAHVVGLGSVFSMPTGLRRWTLQRVMLRLYSWAARASDRVWFTNRHDLEFFVDHGLIDGERTVLTRNYLDTQRAYTPDSVSGAQVASLREELNLEEDQCVVLMVARLIWSKGVREFVEAADRLASSHPNLSFLLVAPEEHGSAEAVPVEWVTDDTRPANFRWLGFRRDVQCFYALADVAVLPSYYREGGYPRALLEPMAMGKPLITTDTDGCRGAVEEGRNGFLIPPRDSDALADAIARLLGDRERLAAFGRHSREKALAEFEDDLIVPSAIRALGFTSTPLG